MELKEWEKQNPDKPLTKYERKEMEWDVIRVTKWSLKWINSFQ